MDALNRLAKWRSVFAGWQLGTRPKGDPECDAVSDHREQSLIMRAEMSALVVLLVDSGVFTRQMFEDYLEGEATLLSYDLSVRFPGISATDDGIVLDERAVETMKGWKP